MNSRHVLPLSKKNIEISTSECLAADYGLLLRATSQATVQQYIDKIRQGLSVVLVAEKRQSGQTWAQLFKYSMRSLVGQREQYWARYQRMSIRDYADNDGWIYAAVNCPAFSPQKALGLLNDLTLLHSESRSRLRHIYYISLEKRLCLYDPHLRSLRTRKNKQQGLISYLEQQLNYVIKCAADGQEILRNIPAVTLQPSMLGLLKTLAKRYINDVKQRIEVIKLMSHGLVQLIE
jgi:hypothetical protein